MLTVIHDITTNNIGSLCYHNTYKSIKVEKSQQSYDGTNLSTDQDFAVPAGHLHLLPVQREG